MIQEDVLRIAFSEEIKQAIVENEAVAATDASIKDGIVVDVWKIEDSYEYNSASNIIRSRNWMKNKALAAEATFVLDLVEAVECGMRGYDERKIITHADCRKMWELLTSEKVKASQFAGYRGSMISKIIALESKTKIEVECVHVKTKIGDDDAITNKCLAMWC